METKHAVATEDCSETPDEANKGESSANDKLPQDSEDMEEIGSQDSYSPEFRSPPIQLRTFPDKYKLNSKNYFAWHQMVETCLSTDCRTLLHLTDPGPKPEDPDYRKWRSEDCRIMLWLLNSLSPQIEEMCMSVHSAKEIWDKMLCTFFKSQRLSKMYILKSKICSTKQHDKKVEDYFSQFQNMHNELEFYRGTLKGWPEDEASIKRLLEEDRTLDFLIGLSPEYDQLTSLFFLRQELPPLMDVYDRIMEVEFRRQSRLSSRDENNLTSNMGKLHVSDVKEHKQSMDKIWCTYCGKLNHTRRQCWKLHGKP